MKVVISNTAGMPIYEQIKRQIKAAIIAGELKENDVLPSLRILAKELKVSVLTTTRAYSELEMEGFVINIQGKGCYVLGQHTELAREQFLREIEAHLQEVIKIAKCANVSNEELHELLNILVEG